MAVQSENMSPFFRRSELCIDLAENGSTAALSYQRSKKRYKMPKEENLKKKKNFPAKRPWRDHLPLIVNT